VEMGVMAPPGSDLVHPRALAGLRHLAKRAFDDRMHEDARNCRISRRQWYRTGRGFVPKGGIKGLAALYHVIGRQAFPCVHVGARRQGAQPDVNIQTCLMRTVATLHRATARLSHIANEQAGQSGIPRPVGQSD